MSLKGLLYLSLEVEDVVRSKEFFIDVLGFALGNDETDKASFDFGQAYLIIRKSESATPGEPGMMPVIRVEDIGDFYETLKQKGAKPGDIYAGEWGFQQFEVTDPDGNRWAFGQPG